MTQEIAEEEGLTVDIEGFEAEMEAQRGRSQSAHETIDLTVQGSIDKLAEHIHPTEFLGYHEYQLISQIEALLVEGKSVEKAESGSKVQLILNKTPFYAESGGQIGDKGYLAGDDVLVSIEDVQKESGFLFTMAQWKEVQSTLGKNYVLPLIKPVVTVSEPIIPLLIYYNLP